MHMQNFQNAKCENVKYAKEKNILKSLIVPFLLEWCSMLQADESNMKQSNKLIVFCAL